MASISICGNLGRDPELKAAGTSQVLSFSVADSEYIYVKNGEAERALREQIPQTFVSARYSLLYDVMFTTLCHQFL